MMPTTTRISIIVRPDLLVFTAILFISAVDPVAADFGTQRICVYGCVCCS